MDLSLRKLWEIVSGGEAWCTAAQSLVSQRVRNNYFPANVLFLFQEGFEGLSVTASHFSLVLLDSLFP